MHHRAVIGSVVLVLAAVLSASLVIPARAADGRIEINQASAMLGGVTPGDAPGFPISITRPGSYVLTGNLVVTDTSLDGFDIRVGMVTLDLNGHELVGPQLCTGEAGETVCTPDGPAPVMPDADGKYPVPEPGKNRDVEYA